MTTSDRQDDVPSLQLDSIIASALDPLNPSDIKSMIKESCKQLRKRAEPIDFLKSLRERRDRNEQSGWLRQLVKASSEKEKTKIFLIL